MARVIVRCVWRLFDVLDFYEAVELARTLECDIWIDWPQLNEEYDENGYCSFPVFITSYEETFLLIYGNTLNLYGYLECLTCDRVDISLDQQEREQGVHYLTDHIGDIFVSVLLAICDNNCQIREEEILWVRAEWASDWFDHLEVASLAELVKDPRYVIFYTITSEFHLLNQKKPDPRLLTIKFYFKVTKFPEFYAWMISLKTLLPLKYCLMIAGADRHERVKSEIDQIETSPQLTSDTLDTFLKAIAIR